MSLFVFLIIIIVSFIAVKVGAVAFELTGLSPQQAGFQSLSAFTGTGFTTRESELIAVHEQRRKIASVLMISGNVGLVTLIATLVNTIGESGSSSTLLVPYFKDYTSAHLIPYINLGLVLLIILAAYQFLKYTRISDFIMKKVKQNMIKKRLISNVSFEEFLLTSGGYVISQIEICKSNPLLGRALSESELKKEDILVLSIEREGQYIPNPQASAVINLGDRLICFGRLENIKKAACAPDE
ncbi:MAG: TrkA C-terminal domain-containing protein [Candidatus Omnitrophota bacterium]